MELFDFCESKVVLKTEQVPAFPTLRTFYMYMYLTLNLFKAVLVNFGPRLC